jgi:hypothetical protein
MANAAKRRPARAVRGNRHRNCRGYRGLRSVAAVMANYHARTAVERELVLRLVSLLWRLRRACPA